MTCWAFGPKKLILPASPTAGATYPLPPLLGPLNIQPVVVVRGLKRQQVAAFTNFVGCFSCSVFFFLSLGAE